MLHRTYAVVVTAPDFPCVTEVERPEDLLRLPLIGSATQWPGAWMLRHGDGREVVLSPEPPLRLGSPLAMRDAVMAGAGTAMLPTLLAGLDNAAGRLFHVLLGWTSPFKPIQLVYSSAQSMTARLRALIDWRAREMCGLDPMR